MEVKIFSYSKGLELLHFMRGELVEWPADEPLHLFIVSHRAPGETLRVVQETPVLRLARGEHGPVAGQAEAPVPSRHQQPAPARLTQEGEAVGERQAGDLCENGWEAPVAGGALTALAEETLQAGGGGGQVAPA